MHTVMQDIPLTHVPTIEEAEQTVHKLYEKSRSLKNKSRY